MLFRELSTKKCVPRRPTYRSRYKDRWMDGYSLLASRILPVIPADGPDDVRKVGVDEDDAAVGTPGAAQEDGAGAGDDAADEGEAAGLGPGQALLRGEGAEGLGDGVEVGLADERAGAAEDEVDGADDVAVGDVVVALVQVQRVLRAVDAHVVEGGLVPAQSQSHSLLAHSAWQRRRC